MQGPEIFDGAKRHAFEAETECPQTFTDNLQTALIFGADGSTAKEILGKSEGWRGAGQGELRKACFEQSARTYSERIPWRQAPIMTIS